MFSGIVTGLGEIVEVEEKSDDLRRLVVACNYDPESIDVGASIACSGICLTVVERGARGDQPFFAVDTAAETLRLTTAGSWRRGTRINLERSLRLGDEIGGHLVAGHVDGIAELVTRDDFLDSASFMLRVPALLSRLIAVKGSVALDGVALTVNKVDDEMVSVLVIPHTLQVTTFGKLAPGARLNLEVDQLARYVARLMETLPHKK
jgi:riboflavin synthase